MRKGFLAGDSPGGSRAARGVQENGGPEPLSTRERAAHETASLNTGSDASEATLPPNDGASLPQAISGHAVRSQSSIGLDHCLELLQGPSDERRFALADTSQWHRVFCSLQIVVTLPVSSGSKESH